MTFIAIAVCRYNYDLKHKFLFVNEGCFSTLVSFESASFSTQPQPLLYFLQVQPRSDVNTLELSNEVSLSEKKLNHINTIKNKK